MKRLLLSALIATGIHAFFLTLNPEWALKRTASLSRPQPLTFALTYRRPEPTVPSRPRHPSVPVKPPLPVKKNLPAPVKPPPPNKEVTPPPVKPPFPVKKARSRPVQRIKKPPKPAETREAVLSQTVREEPPVPEPASVPADKAPGREVLPMDETSLSAGKEHLPPPGAEQGPSITSIPPLIGAIPEYRKNPPPKYPRIARRRGHEGTVVMEVLVSREGRAKDVTLFQSSGYPVLDRAAMKAVKGWLFRPARQGHETIEMWVKVPVRFQLK